MALLNEEERREKATSLKQFRTAGLNAINQLKSIKAQLPTLKTVVTDDTDNFDATDAADVQIVIDELLAGIATI
jgi:hypothetical protein